MSERITNIRFIPVTKNRSHIGFVNFNFENDIEIRDVAVHVRRDGAGYRLVYPKNKEADRNIVRPINKETQQNIDQAITKHINGLMERA